jgi:hypothetical protein
MLFSWFLNNSLNLSNNAGEQDHFLPKIIRSKGVLAKKSGLTYFKIWSDDIFLITFKIDSDLNRKIYKI